MTATKLGGALVAFTLTAPPVIADPAAQVVDASDPAVLTAIIKDRGYRAVIDADGIGDPMIRSSAGGTSFVIYFYGCTAGKDCRSLLFKVGYDLDDGTTVDVVNAWNAETLFGRAYLDDEDDPWLEMSVNMMGGVSRKNFEDTYDWWEVILDGFEDHIGF